MHLARRREHALPKETAKRTRARSDHPFRRQEHFLDVVRTVEKIVVTRASTQVNDVAVVTRHACQEIQWISTQRDVRAERRARSWRKLSSVH